jgi:transposase
MTRIENVDVDDLRRTLDETDDATSAKRLIAAIAHKNGVIQTELAEWFDVSRRTVYGWLERFETEPVDRAADDDHRAGRPRKLADDDREQLCETLRESPEQSGYDAQFWTPTLVRRHVVETNEQLFLTEFGTVWAYPDDLSGRRAAESVSTDGRPGWPFRYRSGIITRILL